jgi:hypothetical protein
LPNARVFIFREENEERVLMYEALSDAEGYYRTMVPPAPYSLEVHHPNYPRPEPKQVRILDATDEAIVDFQVASPHAVAGTIVGPDKEPMPGVAVTYVMDDYVQAETFTDTKGAYRLTAAPGTGRVHAIPPHGFMRAEPLDPVVQIEKIPHTSVPPIALKELPTLRGRIVSADSTGMGSVLVRTLSLKAPLFALTDAGGHFKIRLEALPEGDNVELRAEHPTRFLRRDFEIGIGEEEEPVALKLRRFQPDLSPNDPQNAPNDLSRLLNEPAPPLTCTAWINSSGLALQDLRGKVVVLVLWAGFDPYGRNADVLSEVILLHRALAETTDDVAFVGVHDDSDPVNVVEQYVGQLGMDFPMGVDVSPRLTHNRYDSIVLPQIVLIDKKGVVRYFDVEGRLCELIKDLRRRP